MYKFTIFTVVMLIHTIMCLVAKQWHYPEIQIDNHHFWSALFCGVIIHIFIQVISAAEPVTVKMRSGKNLTFQSVLLADESLHMWYVHF